MVYTRPYWDDFCGKILQKDLHHNPTEGGKAEVEKYKTQYQETLDLYLTTFGTAPPKDIWPAVKKRFEGGLWRWVNKKHFWVVKKPLFWRG
jgi:hypothetical protein